MRIIPFSDSVRGRWLPSRPVIFSSGCLFVGGLTAVRLLYEGLFPNALGLGNPAGAILLAAMVAYISAVLCLRLFRLKSGSSGTALLLNLFYLLNPAVDLIGGRFLFLASIWLTVLFATHAQGILKRWRLLPVGFVVSFLLPVYLLTLGQTVGTADTFEFQVVIPRLGIVHPTGYPLYLLLTKLFTFIPINSVAWRVNLGTAVYGIAAACLLYQFLKSLTGQRLVSILAAVLFGLTPTFWSQSIQAEVYSLHSLIVAAVLVVVQRTAAWQLAGGEERPSEEKQAGNITGVNRNHLLLAFLLGLGLTNHLTTLVLLPAVFIIQVILFGIQQQRYRPDRLVLNGLRYFPAHLREAQLIIAAFLLPLVLYLYLPLRWQSVNGEAMGAGRFVDWVIGGRFQGALHLTGWLSDPARLGVVGRLLTAEWGWLHLLVAVLGLIVLARRIWPAALFLALVWLGFVYYALSYYVPDISVFLIPAHLVTALFWGTAVAEAVFFIKDRQFGNWMLYLLLSLLMFSVFWEASKSWETVDASQDDGQTSWGRAVLNQPLDPEGAILADSLKFPPLYYLQQAEGLQPEMDIMVLPDEAAYRAALDDRLAAGQTVYLARFIPGLAGVYHLRSVGPLTEVSSQPLTTVPERADITNSNLTFGTIELVGYELHMESPYEAGETTITFYWQTAEALKEVWQVYVRWAGEGYSGPVLSQHPANNNYPTNAWRGGEIVADFHSLPRPILNRVVELDLQVALAPAFTQSKELDWQTVTTAVWEPLANPAELTALDMQVGPLLIDGVSFDGQIRPGSDLAVHLHGFGSSPEMLSLVLRPADSHFSTLSELEKAESQRVEVFAWTGEVPVEVDPGPYLLIASYPGQAAVCSWLAARTTGCVLGKVEVSGVRLPEGAVNFEDKIALLAVDVPDMTLQPGGQLAVNLTWQWLGNMEEDYTVFVQVVNEQDRIVGQEDSWPLQGTFPTSQWLEGEILGDPYLVRLSEDLSPGQYRLYVGWYLLGTQRRLSVVDEGGTAVDDKVVVQLGDFP